MPDLDGAGTKAATRLSKKSGRLRKAAIWGLGVAASLILAIFIGNAVINHLAEQGPVAISYVPDCQKSDVACGVWTRFRQLHPYPYQSIAANTEQNGSLILIVSEPPPSLSKDALDKVVEACFSHRLISLRRLRWRIGTDGWVEDLVLQVKSNNLVNSAVLQDQSFLDCIGVLDGVLFGTTFGGGFERLDSPDSRTWTNTASNLDVSPLEVRKWLHEGSLTWRAVDGYAGQNLSWGDIAKEGLVGTFQSSDNSLVLLTFPTSLLIEGQKNSGAFNVLQVPFREFAISSQSLFGGVWQANGQTAIIGRIRTRPMNELPPLRFETFKLLAAQSQDELSQSYERNAIFAGKLSSGPYIYKDWAPIYLSGPLIDTELGALLNITDQMLKSWSEDGNVEYLYFTYPKPKTFPFHNTALSDILRRKLKSQSVLFNWNTSGSAVIVKGEPFSVLVARETGALPVTYGANGKPASQGGENVFNYENEAYKYFAELHNPNLARVVQYTVLYQLFRAIAKDVAGGKEIEAPAMPPAPIPARAAATALMTDATSNLLDDLDRNRLTQPRDFIQSEVLPKLRLARLQNPNLSNLQLARILSDRFSSESMTYERTRETSLKAEVEQLEAKEKALEEDIDSYKRDVQEIKSSSSPDELAAALKIRQRHDSIEARRTAVDHEEEGLQREAQKDVMGDLREALNALAQNVANLDAIRVKVVESNSAEPKGTIKTPSIVLSWNRREELSSTGGHNVDSRAVHFEPSADVTGITVEYRKGETILRYNPAQADAVESNAGILAREIEHGQDHDPKALTKLIEDSRSVRSTKEALQILEPPATEANPIFARIGTRAYEGKIPFVEDLSGMAKQNECCIFVAHDDKQISYIAEKNEIAPPPVLTYEVRDTPSLVEYLTSVSKRPKGNQKAIIFLDEPEPHVQALTLNVNGGWDDGGISDIARLIGNEHPDPGRVSGIMQSDLRGRRSVLRVLTDSLKEQRVAFLERLGIRRPPATWQRATVAALDPSSKSEILMRTGWNEMTDGIPSAIKVSFETQETSEVALVAGFEGSEVATGERYLKDAHFDAKDLALRSSGTLAQYLMTIKNRLGSLPSARLRRLLIIVQEPGETKTLLTWVESHDDDASSGE